MEGRAPVECFPLTQARPLVTFPPDIWANRFGSIPFNQKELEWYDSEVELHKNKVEAMLIDESSDAVETIKLIDLLYRLGLSYHFQDKIESHLRRFFNSQPDLLDKKYYDLHTIGVVFRIFRQHGFKMSCGIFNKFMDAETGNFKESLADDPKGLLSLFEAAHLSTRGEDILDEALAFARTCLEILAHSKSDLPGEIASSLATPMHKGPPRLKAKEFISFYEKRHQDCDNPLSDTLLRFAKLDFNRVQLLHQQEIKSIYKWSKDMGLLSKLPFARDRIMEYFFWSESIYSEPKYAYARAEFTKHCNLVTILDDVYDTYADFDDLPILTDVIQRWDRGIIDQLPRDYMKHLYRAYLDTFDELENHAANDGTSMAVSLTRDYLVEFVRICMLEAEWIKTGYRPSFENSLDVGIISAGKSLMHAIAFLGMGKLTFQAFNWLQNGPALTQAASLIARLSNDLVSHKRDEESGNMTCPFSCYKREHNSSDEETMAEFRQRISIAWKTVNEELMRESETVPLEILMRVVNFARLVEFFYKAGDGITDGKNAEGWIKTMYIDPIPL